MPANTTKHGFTYPVDSDLAGTGDGAIQTLATQLDTKLSMPMSGASFKYVENIVMYENMNPNMTNYILINTNLSSTSDAMVTLRVRGYVYAPEDNTIDFTVGIYMNANFNLATEVISNGNFKIREVYLIERTDGKLTLAIKPDSANGYWHYPKMWVDAMFGHTVPADSAILTGWSMDLVTTVSSGTTLRTLTTAMWMPVPAFENGWVNYDGRTAQFTKTADGWVKFRGLVKSGTMGANIFTMPVGYRPEQRVNAQHYLPTPSIDLFGAVQVWSTGPVVASAGSNGWIDLSAITYRVAPPGQV